MWEIQIFLQNTLRPTPREGHAVALVDDIMYLYGGSNSKGILSDFYLLNLKTVSKFLIYKSR